jgi:uncharacterized Ntn-hydrolase superfamily protein
VIGVSAARQEPCGEEDVPMTYSIVARDRMSGRFGIAIQTCWPFVGAGCPWVESGVGAVVTQSYAEVAHGPNGLARLRTGEAPAEALAAMLGADPGRDIRQVGIVAADGRSAAYTGARCVQAAGHVTAEDVSIQANMMEGPTVWPAMLAAWQSTDGELADRLLAALRAAEAQGGDLRGRQAAALVISGTPTDPPWLRSLDLRVDDDRAPLDELERLLRLRRGYDQLDVAEDKAAAGDLERARAASEEASRLAPDDSQVLVWRAVGMAAAGLIEPARALLATATETNPRWPEFVRRFVDAGPQPELVAAARRLLEA